MNNLTDLQCESNDVDISFADVTFYSINDPDPVGGFTELQAGQEIDCVPGDVIYAVTDAYIANNAQARYDFGLWINPDETAEEGEGALTGSSCLHFNLIPGQDGSTTEETGDQGGTPDQCGDISADADTVIVRLDTLSLICPAGGATTVTVDACAAWANGTTGDNDRVCPVTEDGEGNPVTQAIGFRLGTTPGTTAKCRCEPLDLPINVKGVIRVDKVTVPSGAGQSFDFTPTGTGFTTPFSLTDAATPHSSGPINAGTYTITETVPTGWDLTGRNCVITGTSDAADFTNTANGVSVDLASGQDVTCTFTNTQQASLKIIKDAVPNSAQDFDFDGTGTGISADFDLDDDADGTLPNFALFSGLTPGGTRTVTETAVAGWTLTNIACIGATNSTVTIGASGGFTAGDVSVSVVLAAGEAVECTFTNTRHGVTVTKTATETFKRGYAWGIVKTANPAGPIDLDPGQIYSQDYDIAVDTTGYTDSAFAVSGNITITNPNAFAVSVTAVGDTISGGVGGVSVSCPQTLPYSLAAGGNLVCTYESSLPDGTTRTNTASVTLAGITDPFTDDESVTFVGASPSSYQNNCLAVSDVWNGGAPEALGTVCVTGTPHSAGAQTAPHTFDMDKTIPTGPAQCGQVTYNNTATGTTNTSGTEVSDDASLVVNIECPQGCTLTQGYWKTHNQSFRDARNGRGPAPDDAWFLIGGLGEDTPFFGTGQTWFQIFWTAPKGNVYYNLAHQYMAAKLNILDGVDASATIDGYIAEAETLFGTYTIAQIGAMKANNPVRQRFVELAGYLGAFNEGSAGVDHCTEDQTSSLQ